MREDPLTIVRSERASLRHQLRHQIKHLLKHVLLASVFLISSASFGASLIDAHFKYERKSGSLSQRNNALTGLYRGFLAKSMYSRCHWFPSDSQYMKLASAKCGPLKGTLMAIARFMSEPNAQSFNSSVVNDHGRIRFVDFEINCDAL